MKTARKALMLILCAALLVSATVMGTLAYLQDTTQVVENTFSVGQVHIDLDETDVDVYGDATGEGRDKANTYKLIPGHTYTKDPIVHVQAASEVSYVFVKVENGIAAVEADKTIAAQMKDNGWNAISEGSNIFVYKETVDARDTAKDIPVFGTFTVKTDAEITDTLTTAEINITAYAIQADGFDGKTAAEIYAAGFGA